MKIHGNRKLLLYKNLLPEYLEKRRENFVPEIEPKLIEYDERFFKKVFPYKEGVKYENYQLSNIGKYSIFFPNDADKTAKIIRSFFGKDENVTITDATSNMGGATIAFTNHFNNVNAVEIVPYHCKILENNLKNYGTLEKVKIFCNDYLDIGDKIKQDAIFFDPPWGGPDYKQQKILDMYLDGINMIDIIKNILDRIKVVAMRVPFNYNLKQVLKLTEKSNVFTFYKPDGRLNYFLVVLIK